MAIPYIRLPFSVPAAAGAPVLASADVRPLFSPPPEDGATAHWDLGAASGLKDRLTGRLLTVQGAAPAYNGSYVTLTGYGNGLLTDLADQETQTLCAVIQWPAVDSTAGVLIGGAMSNVSGEGGSSMWIEATGPALQVRARPNAAILRNKGAPVAGGTWVFVALAEDYSGTTRSLTAYVGGLSPTTDSAQASDKLVSTAHPIAIGNAWYSGSYAGSLNIAEFVVFRAFLDTAALGDVYARAKARAAYRGISVV